MSVAPSSTSSAPTAEPIDRRAGPPPGPEASAEVLTATPRTVLRRRRGLIGVVVVLLLAVIALIAIRSSPSASTDELDTTNPAPQGSRALAQVLRQHGVTVVQTDSLRTTRAAITDPSDTTVLVYDPDGFMTAAQRSGLLRLGTDVVAVQPGLLALDEFTPGVGLAGELSGTFSAGCRVDAAVKAGSVSASGLGYRAGDDGSGDGDDTSACFTRGGVSGLVQLADGSRTVTVLGLGTALENGTIARRGDAALALNLLGEHHHLVWYLSTYADLQAGATPTLAELTPRWVTPLLILLTIAAFAALIWRGRRFGPIVVENLPVVVRASETMEGRARLYAHANARLRALDALRIGAIDRLARLTGLPRAATVDEVIDAVSTLLGRDRGAVASLLLDAIPSNDAALVHFSDLLMTLEADVARAVVS